MEVKGNQIIGNDFRFTILTDRLIRMEFQEEGIFENRLTTAVVNRDFKIPSFAYYEKMNDFALQIETDYYHLYYRGGEFTGDSLFVDSKYNYGTHFNRWFYGEENRKNLKGTTRTLDRVDGAIELDDGIMSSDGFGFLDDSKSALVDKDRLVTRERETIDLYGFFYGREYNEALYAYYQLTGFPPEIPRFALGNWWSRYYPYDEQTYLALMDRFNEDEIPFSVSVIDMDWHLTNIPEKYGSGWTGYTWDKDLFPKPDRFLSELHERDKKVTLNLHPAAGIRAFEEAYQDVAQANDIDPESEHPVLMDFNNPQFVESYFKFVLHPLEEQGVDFWWIDWQQGGKRSEALPDPLWLQNTIHYEDQRTRKNEEALILSRYAGPGSHRYPIGFSGDTVVSWESLEFQPYFNATATNIGYTWWSNDIGGHYRGVYDSELTTRWFQLGVFSPIMRLHSSDNHFINKDPRNFDIQTESIMKQYLQLRHKLVPYMETANIETHMLGIPLIEPLYYRWPDTKEAYNHPNEFFFGSQMLISAITRPSNSDTNLACTETFLPPGRWFDYFTGKEYSGGKSIRNYRTLNEYPVFVKEGGIIIENANFMEDINQLPIELDVKLYPGKANKYTLRERLSGDYASTEFSWDYDSGELALAIEDSSNILPDNRILNIISPLEDNRVLKSIELSSNHLRINVKDKYLNNDKSGTNKRLVYNYLRGAKMSNDVKKKVWKAVETMHARDAISTIITLTDSKIYEPIIEVLLG